MGVTPSAWANPAVYTAFEVGAVGNSIYTASGESHYTTNCFFNTSGQNTYGANGFATEYQQASGQHRWYTAASGTAGNSITFTNPMTLTASGNLFLGTTSQVNAGLLSLAFDTGFNCGIATKPTNNAGYDAARFFNSSTTQIGSIACTTTGTLYNITSDYRLKTVIGPVNGAGQRIDALQPIEYTWNADGSSTRGFLAHQFQEVYANSVSGNKDAVDAEGKPIYQAMQASTSEVIADLVAEIQSLRQRLSAANL